MSEVENEPQQKELICIKNLKVPTIGSQISFTINSGEILGVLFENEKKKEQMGHFFAALASTTEDSQGEIIIKGKDVTKKRKSISLIEWNYQSLLTEFSFIKRLERDEKIIKNRVISTLKGIKKFCKQHKLRIDNLRGTSLFLHTLHLDHHKKSKIGNLTDSEYLRVLIAKEIVQNKADVILMEVPEDIFGNFELQEFKRIIRDLGRLYHITFILVASREFLAECDHVLNLTTAEKRKTRTATRIATLLDTIPQMGEDVLKVELNEGSSTDIESLKTFSDAIIIETHENESYTIFPQKDIDKTIVDIFRVIGRKIYNFKRVKPSLTEYLVFTEKS
ncbi:MAG: hypothetical protein ACFFD4_06960 [Candidatus Odinarchaeota archaeon]